MSRSFVGWDFIDTTVAQSLLPSTPLVYSAWFNRLQGYNLQDSVCQGIRFGFRLGLSPIISLKCVAVAEISPPLLREKVMKEVVLGRILGPFQSPPIPGLQLSPLSLVEKEKGKFRLIHNLSSPRGHSVNEAIPDSLKGVTYCSVPEVVQYLKMLGPQADIYLTKFDIQDAFRIVPVHKDDWRFLGMTVDGAYFVDTRLPMGCGTSCAIFQSLTAALCWILEKFCPGLKVFGYLDDFLLVSTSEMAATEHKGAFRSLCAELGVPIAEEKTVGPSKCLVFLGIGLDITSWVHYLEATKVCEVIDKIDSVLSKKALKKVEWQSIVGTLSFLCQIVIPGRAFMSRLCKKLAGAKFWIHMDQSSRQDLAAWRAFIADRMFRPLPMLSRSSGYRLSLFTDAAASLGFGALFGRHWFYGSWHDSWWAAQNIMLLELFPIWAALHLWNKELTGCCLQVYTDNMALVPVLKRSSSKLHYANALLRQICILTMRFNIVLQVYHIAGSDNVHADLLSRLQVRKFKEIAGNRVDLQPTPLGQYHTPESCKTILKKF